MATSFFPATRRKEERPIAANPANAVLFIANMQNDFCKPGGAVFDERPLLDMPAVIDKNRELVQRARGAGIPIVYIQSVRTLEEPEFVIYHKTPMVRVGSWGAEIVEELAPKTGDAVVQAWTDAPFLRTRLGHVIGGLAEEPSNTLAIITGGDICGLVYQLGVRLRFMGFWTVLVTDAVYGDEAGKQFTLGNFSMSSRVNVFFSRSDIVGMSSVARKGVTGLVPYNKVPY